MYQKPDFVKVSVKVQDVFANYSTTRCPEDEEHIAMWTGECEGTSDYVSGLTKMSSVAGFDCYTTQNP